MFYNFNDLENAIDDLNFWEHFIEKTLLSKGYLITIAVITLVELLFAIYDFNGHSMKGDAFLAYFSMIFLIQFVTLFIITLLERILFNDFSSLAKESKVKRLKLMYFLGNFIYLFALMHTTTVKSYFEEEPINYVYKLITEIVILLMALTMNYLFYRGEVKKKEFKDTIETLIN